MDKCTHRIWGAGTSSYAGTGSYACKNVATLERSGRPVCSRHSAEGLKQHKLEIDRGRAKAMQEGIDREKYNDAAGRLSALQGLSLGDMERRICELKGEISY